jgi:hypothetical protein
LRFVLQSQSKSVRTINIYCNEKVVRDLGELRNKWALWRKIGTISLQQHQVCAFAVLRRLLQEKW